MESLQCSLDDRLFQALLIGLNKMLFQGDTNINIDYLIQQLFSGSELTDAEIKAQISAFQEVEIYLMK